MYNANFKNKFIKNYTESESVRKYCKTLFDMSERYEREHGKDLAEFNADLMQILFDKRSGIRQSSKTTLMNVLNAYLTWAKKNGRNVVCDVRKELQYNNVEKFRSKVVFSPEHLNRYMDAVFGLIEEKTVSVIYRTYLWMAFCDIDQSDTHKIMCSDVDLDYMRVMVNGREVPLYAESLPAFREAKTLREFRVINPHTPNAVIWVAREDGDRVLRTTKRNGVSNVGPDKPTWAISREIAKKTREAVESGVVRSRLNYNNVKLSGVLYRMYLRECMGMEPDFSILAAIKMESYSFENKASYLAKKSHITNSYRRDYEVWKQAYEQYKEDSLL